MRIPDAPASPPTSPASDALVGRGRGISALPRSVGAAAALAALAAAAVYVPYLATGFASEDFLIFAHLSREDLAATVRDELASAWLGLESVGFWRPVSTILLAIEMRALGLDATRLHALHLLLHAWNAFLVGLVVARVARPPAPALAAAGAALLFALHPLHPSAVLFTGAFATLHGATFSLLAVLCFITDAPAARAVARSGARSEAALAGAELDRESLDRTRRRRRRLDLVALAFFALALGSYEASAALPAVLLAIALAQPASRGALRRVLPFFGVLGVYFALRLLVLGAAIGGYDDLRSRILDAPADRSADLARAMARLLHPAYESGAGLPGAAVAVAAIALGALGSAALVHHRRSSSPLLHSRHRAVLAGLAWGALALAPFGFVGLVPANGRYAYLAVAGVLLAIAALVAAATERWRRTGTVVMVCSLGVIAADWAVLLRRNLDAHDRASDLVAELRRELERVAAASPPDASILVEDHPHFVSTATGAPVAKVLQYGLAESILPPFGSSDRAVVPLPAIVAPPARAALDALPGTVRYRWNAAARRLEPIGEGAHRGDSAAATSHTLAEPPLEIEVDATDAASGFLDATCSDCAGARLVVVTSAFPFTAPPVRSTSGRARFAVPDRFLRGVARQRRGPAFFWIEERRGEEVVAMSAVARFALDGDAPRSFVRAAAKIARLGAGATRGGGAPNEGPASGSEPAQRAE